MPALGKSCCAVVLGSVEYAAALRLQMQICEQKKRSFHEDVLLLLEHPPTITLGRNGNWQHLLASAETLAARGVGCHETDRGGDITFHGPGQLVGYPLLQLEAEERDVHLFMRNLEEVLIRVLHSFGIEASRRPGAAGVWTGWGKIAALGVHISRWITHHGFALNVQTDLSFFDLIVPCGIVGSGVASMSSILHRPVQVSEVVDRLIPEFGQVMGRKMAWLSEQELRERLESHAREIAVA